MFWLWCVGNFHDHNALFLAWNSAFSFPPCGIKRSQSDQSCSTWRRCAAYRNHITLWWLKSVACLVQLRVGKKNPEMEALCLRRILCSPLQLLNTYSTFPVSEVCRLDPLRPPPLPPSPFMSRLFDRPVCSACRPRLHGHHGKQSWAETNRWVEDESRSEISEGWLDQTPESWLPTDRLQNDRPQVGH